jgi:hypothetical protein
MARAETVVAAAAAAATDVAGGVGRSLAGSLHSSFGCSIMQES